MAEIDPRLGEKNEDGSVKRWPQTDIKGQPFGPGATAMGWGARGFVVLTVGDNTEALAQLERDLAPPATENQAPPVTQNGYESDDTPKKAKPKGTGDVSTPAAE